MALSTKMQATLDAIIAEFSTQDGKIQLTHDQLTEKLTPKSRKPKTPKRDPNIPKGPKSAFQFWSKENRDAVKGALIMAHVNDDVKINAELVNAELKLRWNQLEFEQKSQYIQNAKVDRQRYNEQMAAYYIENGIEKPKRASTKFNNNGELPKVEGCSEPIEGFIEGSPTDADGKRMTKGYHNIEDALAEARKIGAGGVTRTSVGYKVRMGRSVSITEKSRSKGEISWLLN